MIQGSHKEETMDTCNLTTVIDEQGNVTEARLWSWSGKTMAVLADAENVVLLPSAFAVLEPEDQEWRKTG